MSEKEEVNDVEWCRLVASSSCHGNVMLLLLVFLWRFHGSDMKDSKEKLIKRELYEDSK